MSEKEFIEQREHQLPADPQRVASDMRGAGEAVKAFAATPPGEPVIDYDVRSIFDSRPINGWDANFMADSSAFVLSGTSTTLSVTIPDGLMFVFREMHHCFNAITGSAIPPFTARPDVLATLLKNGGNVPYNVGIPVGVESDGTLKGFALYDENDVLSVRFDYTGGVAPASFTLFMQIYGNLLPKTGRAYNLEIANPVGGRTKRASIYMGGREPPPPALPPPPAPAARIMAPLAAPPAYVPPKAPAPAATKYRPKMAARRIP